MSPEPLDQHIDRLETELRALDERIAKARHDLIWAKRSVPPGEPEPPEVQTMEAEYLALSEAFTRTWEEWRTAHRAAESA
ncbi:MAG: hypothetical protein NZ518_05725 [Dehalococcoidia bacterium]|nr:hypothetical protein [Dehalococcoidia bacterium]